MLHKFNNVSDAIAALRNEKSKTCISILIPLGHLNAGQEKDWDLLNETIQKSNAMLDKAMVTNKQGLISAINSLVKTINFNRNDKGLGIYVSDHIAYFTPFPFEVTENVYINDKFFLKELYMLDQYSKPYFVVSLSEKKARLFQGHDTSLREIKNKYFPLENIDDYEYSLPSRTSQYSGSAHVKSYEKDKKSVEKMRFNNFIEKVDHHLDHYLNPNNDSLLICGTKTHTSAFLHHTNHQSNIIGITTGGYDWFDENDYSRLIWPTVETYADTKGKVIMSLFEEKLGAGQCAIGMDQVWNAVFEGRVSILLIEKGFDTSGYSLKNMPHLFLLSEPAQEYQYYSSALNELIDLAIAHNSKVFFVDVGLIPGNEHVGAICRY